jgi:hypothetical protein
MENRVTTAARIADGGPAALAASASPSPRRVTGLAYSGDPMRLAAFGATPVVIDLAGVRVPKTGVPLLRDHDLARPLGTAAVSVTAAGVAIAGMLNGSPAAVEEITATARNGFPWQLSVGGHYGRAEYLEAGRTARVNARTVTGPVQIIRDFDLREISLVAVAADAATSLTVAATAAKGIAMNETADPVAVAPTGATAPAPAPAAGALAASAAAGGVDAAAESRLVAQREEDIRRHRIQTLVEAAVARTPDRTAAFRAIGNTALAQHLPVMATENELLRAAMSFSINPMHPVTDRTEAALPAVIQASLCQAMGLKPAQLKDHFPEPIIDASTQKQYRVESLHGLIRAAFVLNGMSAPNRVTPNDLRTLADVELRAGSTSTYNLPGILSDAANKVALETYKAVATTWPLLAKNVSLSNFKAHNLYRLTVAGEMEEVPKSGAIVHGTLSEAEYAVRAKTYGKMIGITRQDVIDDDLQAFTAVPALLTRKAVLAVEKALYKLVLTNAASFFGAGNRNATSGALGLTGLGAAYKAFREFVDDDGDPTLVMPKYLVVPPALEMLARQLVASVTVVGGSAAGPAANPFAAMFEVLASPYLAEAVGLSEAADDDAYYLFAPAGDYAAVAVGTLNGNAAPTVEQANYDFDRLGISTRCYFDFGVSFLDPRGAVRSDGQA